MYSRCLWNNAREPVNSNKCQSHTLLVHIGISLCYGFNTDFMIANGKHLTSDDITPHAENSKGMHNKLEQPSSSFHGVLTVEARAGYTQAWVLENVYREAHNYYP